MKTKTKWEIDPYFKDDIKIGNAIDEMELTKTRAQSMRLEELLKCRMCGRPYKFFQYYGKKVGDL